MIRKIGSFLGSALRKVGDFGGAVSKIANNPITRTVATGIGALGRLAAPEVSMVNPALGGIVNSVSRGLQSGSILNKVSNIASRVGNASNNLAGMT